MKTPSFPSTPLLLERIRSGRWWMGLLSAGIVLAAIAAYYPDVADDFDVWWHLEYGRHFIQNWSWTIDHSAFSWPPSDPSWVYVSWIGSSLLYLIHQIGGYPALAILQWLIFFGVAGLFLGFVRLCRSAWTTTHLAGLLLVGVAVNPVAVYIKPELFTLLFFTAAVFIYFASKVSLKNLFWLYPPLFLVWVNTHGGFINGLGFITLALMAEATTYVFKHPARMPKPLLWKFAAGVGLAYAVALINPHGIEYGIRIFQNASKGESHIRSIMAYFPLWNYLFPAGFPFRKTNAAWAMVLMAAVLLALTGAAWIQKKRLSPPVLALNLVFFIFGFSVFRASMYFCILWLFSCHYLDRLGQWRLHSRGVIPAFSFSLVVAVMIICETAVYNTYDSRFGSRIENFVPAAESAFVTQNRLPGPLFNDYLSGGYLMWAMDPSRKVFIDSRYGPYESTGVWKDYLTLLAGGDLRLLDAKYRCNTALIMNSNYRLITLFLKSPDWALMYFDKAGAVFVRKTCLNDLFQSGRQADMRPERFKDISNPRILSSAFFLYCHYHPPAAPRLLAYYQAHVRNSYRHRVMDIRRMKAILRQLGMPDAETKSVFSL